MERLDHFMARANSAYYAEHDPFSDFTTAPEISQAFGELLGLWAGIVWQSMGSPEPMILAEAGPGRGTLMADALRAIQAVMPDFAKALRVVLIETSPRLKALQARAVPQAEWCAAVEELPPEPFILLANEFLDALPIRQFVRRQGAWAERFVQDETFVEVPAETPRALAAAEGEIVEISEARERIAAFLGRRLAIRKGAALFLDYGPARSAPGESLQAIRAGRPSMPLQNPGQADLTAHVDFEALAKAARAQGAAVYGPLAQGIFLSRLGLFARIDRLARGQPPKVAASLIAGAQRLTAPEYMGSLFKALAFAHPDLPIPPGFAQ
jgi:NADH dehydrogenase [ubiquinone] 1 alpha subcomplex assembly factor 7